jgi:hypothetical protein
MFKSVRLRKHDMFYIIQNIVKNVAKKWLNLAKIEKFVFLNWTFKIEFKCSFYPLICKT